LFAALASASALGLKAWNRPPAAPPAPAALTKSADIAPAAEPSPVRVQFRDLAKAAGVAFKHQDSPSDMHYVPEIMGGGVAWLDYDQDGYMDLFLVQGGKFPADPEDTGRLRDPARRKKEPTSRLYPNRGDGTFADVTEKVGLWHPDFGQGVTAGDYDNDGFPDLFVACYGHCHLYHNEPDPAGGRRFRDVS